MTKRRTRTPTRGELLREYELCQTSAQSIEDRIWSSAGIIGAGAFGSVLIDPIASQPLTFPQLSGLSLVAFLLTLIWWRAACRWWDIEHSKLDRIRDIETDLGLYQHRYAAFRDGYLDARATDIPPERKDKLSYDPRFARGAVRGSIRFLVIGVYLAWFGILAVRVLSDPAAIAQLKWYDLAGVLLFLAFGLAIALCWVARRLKPLPSRLLLRLVIRVSGVSAVDRIAVLDQLALWATASRESLRILVEHYASTHRAPSGTRRQV